MTWLQETTRLQSDSRGCLHFQLQKAAIRSTPFLRKVSSFILRACFTRLHVQISPITTKRSRAGFPLLAFHFPLSTFHFPLSTFHFPLFPLFPPSLVPRPWTLDSRLISAFRFPLSSFIVDSLAPARLTLRGNTWLLSRAASHAAWLPPSSNSVNFVNYVQIRLPHLYFRLKLIQ